MWQFLLVSLFAAVTYATGCNDTKLQTEGGNSKGACCKFPFTYEGGVYNSCTDVNRHRLWCGTSSDAKTWGYCKGKCTKTEGGNGEGACCVFPFKYRGDEEQGCLWLPITKKYWCGTTYEDNKYGYCVKSEVTPAPVVAKKPSPSQCVKTQGGNSEGGCCVFPFKYEGKEYNSCLWLKSPKFFCGTTYEQNKWGYCVQTKEGLPVRAWSSSVLQNNKEKYGPQLAIRSRSSSQFGYFNSRFTYRPWLRVEIPVTKVAAVGVINKKHCCGWRFWNLQVRAGMVPSNGNNMVAYLRGYGRQWGEHIIEFDRVTEPVKAKYITFQLRGWGFLQIGGVRLYQEGEERGGPRAWSSSVYGRNERNYGPQLAMKGGSSSRVGFFQSQKEDEPWLRVQIPVAKIAGVGITNRKDCCGERLKNLQVRAGMSPNLENSLVGSFEGPGKTGDDHIFMFKNPVEAKYITFQLMGSGYLQINGIWTIKATTPTEKPETAAPETEGPGTAAPGMEGTESEDAARDENSMYNSIEDTLRELFL